MDCNFQFQFDPIVKMAKDIAEKNNANNADNNNNRNNDVQHHRGDQKIIDEIKKS